jgi:hypothetical protein
LTSEIVTLTLLISRPQPGFCVKPSSFFSTLSNLLGYIVGIASILIFISTDALALNDYPPITHCFKNENNISFAQDFLLFSIQKSFALKKDSKIIKKI